MSVSLIDELLDIFKEVEMVAVASTLAMRKRMLREVALGSNGVVCQRDGFRLFVSGERAEEEAKHYLPNQCVRLQIGFGGVFQANHLGQEQNVELPDLDIWLDEVLGPPQIKV